MKNETKVAELKTKEEMMTEVMNNLSPEQKAAMYPPVTRKNFVVRKSWLGRNQIITFTNNKNEKMTYNHDEVLKLMLPKLSIQPCWIKRGYWSQSTNMPMVTRHLATIE
jgi:hypothetical protein